MNIEIGFAYTSFKWNNNAKHNAAVICLIVGVQCVNSAPIRLFSNNNVKVVCGITPYIVEGKSNSIVDKISKPISTNFPEIRRGNSPTDDGNLIFTSHEKDEIINKYPLLDKYIKKYIGSVEFINGTERWVLYLKDEDLAAISNIPEIANRLERVKKFRLQSKQSGTYQLASFPNRYFYCSYQETEAIIIPRVSSERRKYIPIGLVDEKTLIADSAFTINNGNSFILGILTSFMHMVWVRSVGGRLKTDYRYSSQLCYNTFPFPKISAEKKREIEAAAEEVLITREYYPEKTLAELYDPDKMPQDLRKAHAKLDDIVESCYPGYPFASDESRLECLFKLYEKMTSGK
ncbi:MAG: class I SAM-dependent DNA methyltransferase [Prevotella sp.]|nr:class I SAM-dependent DNA methyltransferase [Prevotella sp.]